MKRISSLLFVFLLAGCAQVPPVTQTTLPKADVTLTSPKGDHVTVTAELARTEAEREQGLMYRTSLPHGSGMLFVFTEAQVLNFWMKNTKIPLDVLYFDSDGMFVSLQHMDPCTADPCPSYTSGSPASFALEVPQGFSTKYNIGIGWKLDQFTQTKAQ